MRTLSKSIIFNTCLVLLMASTTAIAAGPGRSGAMIGNMGQSQMMSQQENMPTMPTTSPANMPAMPNTVPANMGGQQAAGRRSLNSGMQRGRTSN